MKNKTKWKTGALIIGLALSGCASGSSAASSSGSQLPQSTPEDDYSPDYLVLVNQQHRIPENWADEIRTETFANTLGEEMTAEKTAYEAYLQLKQEMEQEEVYIDIASTLRSEEEQQEAAEQYEEEYGSDYVIQNIAAPGYSEHHTGLAFDLFLLIGGEAVKQEEEMLEYPDIWSKIHSSLADYGFILRYMEGKEDITGYPYEPWHIRYVGGEAAREISGQGITLEEYLGEAAAADVQIDYGSSEIYTKEDMDEAITLIRQTLGGWEGCELHNVRYTSDDCNSEENISWMNELRENQDYIECIEFLTDFHSPAEGSGAFEPDHEYTDYQWYLARPEGGRWELLSYGY